jgi:hypothetical protein
VEPECLDLSFIVTCSPGKRDAIAMCIGPCDELGNDAETNISPAAILIASLTRGPREAS